MRRPRKTPPTPPPMRTPWIVAPPPEEAAPAAAAAEEGVDGEPRREVVQREEQRGGRQAGRRAGEGAHGDAPEPHARRIAAAFANLFGGASRQARRDPAFVQLEAPKVERLGRGEAHDQGEVALPQRAPPLRSRDRDDLARDPAAAVERAGDHAQADDLQRRGGGAGEGAREGPGDETRARRTGGGGLLLGPPARLVVTPGDARRRRGRRRIAQATRARHRAPARGEGAERRVGGAGGGRGEGRAVQKQSTRRRASARPIARALLAVRC